MLGTLATAWCVAATCAHAVEYERWSLKEYEIVYEGDLELGNSLRMDFYGKVHANGDWYLRTDSAAYFHRGTTAAGSIYSGVYNPLWKVGYSSSKSVHCATMLQVAPNPAPSLTQLWTSGVDTNKGWLSSVVYNPGDPAGNPIYVPGGQPEDWWPQNPEWPGAALATFKGLLADKSLGVRRIDLFADPTLTGHDCISAPTDDDPIEKITYNLAYEASVILEPQPGWSALTSAQFTSLMLDADTANDPVKAFRIDIAPDGMGGLVRTNVDFPGLSYTNGGARTFVSKVRIYDGREGKYVNLLDIDLSRLIDYFRYASSGSGAFKLSHPGLRPNGEKRDDGIMYVRMDQATVPSSEFAGVRIRNMPDMQFFGQWAGITDYKGFAFATDGPLYAKGDVAETYLMLAGDSITILSEGFSDATYATGSGNGPVAPASADVETQAVCIAGTHPTTEGRFGGGATNFFRYLENWSGKTHKSRHTIIAPFESRVSTAPWDKDGTAAVNTGYFSAPERDFGWYFVGDQPPPGMPTAVRPVADIQGDAWAF